MSHLARHRIGWVLSAVGVDPAGQRRITKKQYFARCDHDFQRKYHGHHAGHTAGLAKLSTLRSTTVRGSGCYLSFGFIVVRRPLSRSRRQALIPNDGAVALPHTAPVRKGGKFLHGRPAARLLHGLSQNRAAGEQAQPSRSGYPRSSHALTVKPR